jgi:RimJ/RimL family protein N-acetyltransferase
MFELDVAHVARGHALLDALAHLIPLAGVLEGRHHGRIFVDDLLCPTVALVWTPWGYYYLGGDVAPPASRDALAHLLRETLVPASVAGGEPGLLLTLGTPDWAAHLDYLLGASGVIEAQRRTFTFDRAAFARRRDQLEAAAPDFAMRPVGYTEAQLLEGELRATWPSLDAFLDRGMGFCLLRDGEPVSACTSAFVAGGAVEIGVYTDPAYRRRGLATLTATALIEACLDRGLRPNWECFADNAASVALAQRLGFVPAGLYPIYYWEV